MASNDDANRWGYPLGLFNTTVAPLVTAGLCSAADVTPAAPAAVAAAVGGGILLRRWLTRSAWTSVTPWSEAAFKAATAISAGAWTAWSTVTGPWHTTNLAAGAAAAAIGALIAPAFLTDDPTPQPSTPVDVAPSRDPRAVAWKTRIEKICRIADITVADLQDWPNRAGYTFTVHFADESGDTWEVIDQAKRRLAGAAKLAKGCVIGVAEGDVQGSATVRVPTINALGMNDVWMDPNDVRRRSITDEHVIGIHDDTSDACIELRQSRTLAVAMPEAGKTNLLLRMICRMLECDDVIVIVIDLNGGGLAVPLMMPYIEGDVDEPPVAFVAYDEKTAIAITGALLKLVRDRKARYGRLKAKANTDLLPVSHDLPQVMVVGDEMAEVAKRAPQAMENILEIQRIGRAEGGGVVYSALRGTQDTIPVAVRKLCAQKLVGLVESDSEMQWVLPHAQVKSTDLIYPGTFFLERRKQTRQLKVHRTNPELIAEVVRKTAAWRPPLDAAGAMVMGEVWQKRMELMEPWLSVLRGGADPSDPAGDDDHDEPAAAAVSARTEPANAQERDLAREKARTNLRRFVAVEQVKEMPADRLASEFDRLIADVKLAEPDTEPAAPTPDVATSGEWNPALLLDLVKTEPGIRPTQMLDRLAERNISVSEKTLYKWLNHYVDEGKLAKADGKYTRCDG